MKKTPCNIKLNKVYKIVPKILRVASIVYHLYTFNKYLETVFSTLAVTYTIHRDLYKLSLHWAVLLHHSELHTLSLFLSKLSSRMAGLGYVCFVWATLIERKFPLNPPRPRADELFNPFFVNVLHCYQHK